MPGNLSGIFFMKIKSLVRLKKDQRKPSMQV